MSADELDEYEHGVDHDEAIMTEFDDERELSDAEELPDVDAEPNDTLFDVTRCVYTGASNNSDGVDYEELEEAGALLDDPDLVSIDDTD